MCCSMWALNSVPAASAAIGDMSAIATAAAAATSAAVRAGCVKRKRARCAPSAIASMSATSGRHIHVSRRSCLRRHIAPRR